MIKLTIRRPVAFVAGLVIVAGVLAACSSTDGDTSAATIVSSTTVAPSSTPSTYVFETLDPDFDAYHQITMNLLDGYVGHDGVVFGTDDGQGMSAWTVGNVYAEPCHWVGAPLPDPPIDASVDGLVAALRAQKSRRATATSHVTLDGFTGQYMELTVPALMDPDDCDGGEFRTWIDPMGGQRNLEPGQRDLLWIIDVDGTRLVIDSALGPDTTSKDRADRIQMVESIRIEPV